MIFPGQSLRMSITGYRALAGDSEQEIHRVRFPRVALEVNQMTKLSELKVRLSELREDLAELESAIAEDHEENHVGVWMWCDRPACKLLFETKYVRG